MCESMNIRGETPREAYQTAVSEVFAPVLRETLLRGNTPPSKEELTERLERQLENRGFTITDSQTNNQ